jgi:hypothetical protein
MRVDNFLDAKARCLAVLKQAAPNRVSTWTLIHAAQHSRAAGRCWELINEDGYQIEHTNEGRTHFWRFIAEPQVRQPDLFQRSA